MARNRKEKWKLEELRKACGLGSDGCMNSSGYHSAREE